MKFTADRQDVLAAVTKCLKAADSISPHTPFRSLRIETDGKEQIRFFSGSDSMSVDTLIPGDVEEGGGCTVSPFKLDDVAKVIKGKITMAFDDKLLIKSSDRRRYTLQPIDCEMRRLAEPKGSPWSMSATELMAAWNAVQAAVPTEGKNNRIAAAAELIISATGFSLAGSNGVSMIRIEYPGKFKNPARVLVPRKAFTVLDLMSEDDANVKVNADLNYVYWENSDTLSGCKLVGEIHPDGSRAYPPVDVVVEALRKEMESAPSISIAATTLVESLRAVTPMTDDMSAVDIRAKGGVLSFEADSDTCTGREEIAIEPGRDFLVRINGELGKAVLAPFKDKTLTMAHIDSQNALAFASENVFAVISTVQKPR